MGLTKALVVELEPYGIGVSLVNPGPVATDFGAARSHPYDRPPQAGSRRGRGPGGHPGGGGRPARADVPGVFRPAVAIRHVVPPLFRWGTRRSYTCELAEDRRRR